VITQPYRTEEEIMSTVRAYRNVGSEKVTYLRARNCVFVGGVYDFVKTAFFMGIANRKWEAEKNNSSFLMVWISKSILQPLLLIDWLVDWLID
jgi:hypothetical protein